MTDENRDAGRPRREADTAAQTGRGLRWPQQLVGPFAAIFSRTFRLITGQPAPEAEARSRLPPLRSRTHVTDCHALFRSTRTPASRPRRRPSRFARDSRLVPGSLLLPNRRPAARTRGRRVPGAAASGSLVEIAGTRSKHSSRLIRDCCRLCPVGEALAAGSAPTSWLLHTRWSRVIGADLVAAFSRDKVSGATGRDDRLSGEAALGRRPLPALATRPPKRSAARGGRPWHR